jgi:hypothetical protein
MKKKNTYHIKRYWEVCDSVTIEATSVEEAISKAHCEPLGRYPDYVPDSMNSDKDVDVQILKKVGNKQFFTFL